MQKNDVFANRRKKFLQQIGDHNIAIIFASKTPHFHRPTVYPYRQDTNFYYLTGLAEAEAVAVLIPNRAEGDYILFTQDKDPATEVWTGFRIGKEKAISEYGAKQAFSITKLDEILPDLMAGKEQVYFNLEDHEDLRQLMHWSRKFTHAGRGGLNPPTDFINAGKIIHEMRICKDAEEIALMRKAAEITADAQIRAIKKCKPGLMEYEIEAEIIHEFIKNGGRMPSFEPIVASGPDSCILHYTQNNKQLQDGELLLIDVGVEYNFYDADITRTIPINGRFSPEQKAIYQAVLDTQIAVINHIKPGVLWHELQEITIKSITEKLLSLGLLTGNINSLLEQHAYKPFYMHHIGHWLGLDAHDVGTYKVNHHKWRELKPGMTFTVEPGIYIATGLPVDKKWWNIGVRIEDDVLVTETGCEVLTKKVPKTIADIEALMR